MYFFIDIEFVIYQDAEKRPSPSFPSSFVFAAYVQVRLTPQDFACLRVAASAEAGVPRIWAFLSILNKNVFFYIRIRWKNLLSIIVLFVEDISHKVR